MVRSAADSEAVEVVVGQKVEEVARVARAAEVAEVAEAHRWCHRHTRSTGRVGIR